MVRRIRQPARALDVECGVTALSDLRGAALHSGVGLIRRAASHQATGQGVRCRMRRNRLIRPTGAALHSGVGLIRRAASHQATGQDVRCRMRRNRLIRPAECSTSHSFSELPRSQSSLPPSRRGISHPHCLVYTPRSAACCCNAAFRHHPDTR